MTQTKNQNNPVKQEENSDLITGISETEENNHGRGEHPSSLGNLTPFPKGVSGNPLGKPHKFNGLKKSLNSLLDEKVSVWDLDLGGSDESRRQRILIGFLDKAREGSLSHIQFLAKIGCFDEKEEK